MRWVLIWLLLLAAIPAAAETILPPASLADQQLADPVQEANARALMDELRCIVCQGQSIADSDAPMAGEWRALVREKIAAGEAPEAVRAWFVARYGSWVSYRPDFDALSWPLYALPLLLTGFGFWLARSRFKRRKAG
jgi:cytochrome c-type biogenesis protein CcmH